MKIVVEIDDKDAELIFKELNIDMKKGIEGFIKKTIDAIVQLALLKKSGIKINMKKLTIAGVKIGKDTIKKARKYEDVKG